MTLDSPESLEPPVDEIPGLVTCGQTVTAAGDASIVLERCADYSTGVLITFRLRLPAAPVTGSRIEDELRRLLRGEPNTSPQGLLLGVWYGDGSWASTTGGQPEDWIPCAATPLMILMSGRNRRADAHVTYWVSPAGATGVYAQWPEQGLRLGTATIPGH